MTLMERWRLRQTPEVVRAVGALWGKSDAGGQPMLLVQHLLDTAAVAEHMWDGFLAPTVRASIDRSTAGSGRRFFAWLCGAHDLGKATPAFQHQVPGLARAVRATGLRLDGLGPRSSRNWRHERASARIFDDAARAAGWSQPAREWVWPLLAGHHGLFPDAKDINPRLRALHGGTPQWKAVQQGLVDMLTLAMGYEHLAEVEPSWRPPRALQLALSGFVIMADWIASDENNFCGVADFDAVSFDAAHERAARAWTVLGLRTGWGHVRRVADDPLRERFHIEARPGQLAVVEAARMLPCPGLIVVEAPTGEGKTEAALAAAEVLTQRFGADGIFVGMPTQATSDPMLGRVGAWAGQIQPGIQVALLHGKARFNPQWRELLGRRDRSRETPVDADPYGVEDHYGVWGVRPAGIDEQGDKPSESVVAVEEWLLGRKRGLLSPVVVGTVDHLLFAATRTKHVSLRVAGLAGKVVVLDEVHAADVYMQQFLKEALWWLGDCGVSVVLLSATLGARQRDELVSEYLRGATGDVRLELGDGLRSDWYPRVTVAWPTSDGPSFRIIGAETWRPSVTYQLEVLDDDGEDPSECIARFLRPETGAGGCVLVLLNTVRRAQDTYRTLRKRLDCELVLVHGRLTAADRAERTALLLRCLGPPGDQAPPRPKRLVVVATQVAEQSFDIDVDLLVTDVAPVDLLIQRAGRLHRHTRREHERPRRLTQPRIVVTGMRRQAGGPPAIAPAILAVYGEREHVQSGSSSRPHRTPYRAAAPLLRSASLVSAASEGNGWQLPSEVPSLVEAAYSEQLITPLTWQPAEEEELRAFRTLQKKRANKASPFRLAKQGERTEGSLKGIHGQGVPGAAEEEEVAACVRDGPRAVEVVLVERVRERYRTIEGVDLGIHGERIHDDGVLNAAIGGSVRLPVTWPALTRAAEGLGPVLPEWQDHAWLKRTNVLVLENGKAQLAGYSISYHRELGLLVEPPAYPTPAQAGTT